MALGRDVVDAIIREHAYRPITGDVLLIGQQAITLSRDEVLELMREHDVLAAARDEPQVASADSGGMSAAAFFQLLGIERLHMLDIRQRGRRRYRLFRRAAAGSAQGQRGFHHRRRRAGRYIFSGHGVAQLCKPAAARRAADRRQQSERPFRSLFDPERVLVSRLLRYQRIRRLQGLRSRLSARPAGPMRSASISIACWIQLARSGLFCRRTKPR